MALEHDDIDAATREHVAQHDARRTTADDAAGRAQCCRGGVDVVVHVARYIGAGHMDKFLDTPMEQFERHLEGNVLATLRLNKYFVPSMIARGGGTIIMIGKETPEGNKSGDDEKK